MHVWRMPKTSQVSNKAVAVVCIAFINLLGGTAHAGVATLPAEGVTPTSATLRGGANPQGEDTLVWFEWGMDTNYNQITAAQLLPAGTNDQLFSQAVNGLGTGVNYSFRAVGSNSLGIVYGTNETFVTPSFVVADVELTLAFQGRVGWGDYDDDGRLDILLTGWIPVEVWRNTGAGFSNINTHIAFLTTTPAAWGDHDNDGRLDIFAAGLSYETIAFDRGVWRNTGNSFTRINSGLPIDYTEAMSWGDYDNDGRPDILLMGSDDVGSIVQIWRNNWTHFFDSNIGVPTHFHFSNATSGDYDNDGLLDFVICGEQDSPYGPSSQLWRNTGNGFTNVNAGLSGIEFGSLAWGDYDNDGRLDLVLSGYTFSQPITEIWRNTGDGFTNINAGLPGLGEGSVAWGDYDNDGRSDLLLTGRPAYWSGDFISDVWRNTTNGFVRAHVGLMPTADGGTAWGDYDNDGRLDILLTGTTNGGGTWYQYTKLWHNEYPESNTPPFPPTNLNATLDGNDVVFSWGSGGDAETPASGLTYNLRVGTTPGGMDLVAPMSSSNGFRHVPQIGNVYQAHQFKLTRVPLNQPIYWSVQSVDTAFAGSVFAPEMSLRVNTVPGQPPGPTAGDLTGDGLVDQADLSAMLQVLLTSNPPPVLNVSAPTTNRFQLGLPDLEPLNFTVLVSTNLVDWESNGPASLFFDFLDPDATNHAERYYKLQPP